MSAQTTPSRHASDFGPPGSGRNRQRTSSPLSINTTSGKNESGHFRITTNESDDLAKLVSGSDPLPDETSSLSKTLSSRSDPTNIAIEALTDVNLSEGGIMVSGTFMAGKNWSQSGGGPTVASPNDSAVFSSSESDDALAAQDPNSILKFLDDHSDFSPTRKLSSFDPSSASRKIRFEDPNGLGFKDFSAKTPTENKEPPKSMEQKTSQKKSQSSGKKGHAQQAKTQQSSSIARARAKAIEQASASDQATASISVPAEGFSVHRKQHDASIDQDPASTKNPKSENKPVGVWTRRSAPTPSIEPAQGASSIQHGSSKNLGVSISSRPSRSTFNWPTDRKNAWEGLSQNLQGNVAPPWPSPGSDGLTSHHKGAAKLSRRDLQGPETQRVPEESSITVNDFGAAYQEIGQLKSALEEKTLRSDRYKTDRDDLRNVVVAQKAALDQITRKLEESEAGRHLLEIQLHERGTVPLHGHHLHMPAFGPYNSSQPYPMGSYPYQQPMQTRNQPRFPQTGIESGSPAPPAHLSQEPNIDLSTTTQTDQAVIKKGSTPAPATAQAVQQGDDNFQALFRKLFTAVVEWAKSNVNKPDIKLDNALPPNLWQSLRDVSDPGTVVSLLGRDETRWALIARIISSFLVREVLHAYLILGFSDQSDSKIQYIAAEWRKSPGRAFKRRLMDERSTIFREVIARPDCVTFLNNKLYLKSTDLFFLVTPLLDVEANNSTPRQAFNDIVSDTFDLAKTMFALPVEWIFKFPYAGDRFSSHGMTNEDRDFAEPVSELDRRHLRVKLSITPGLIKRNEAGPSLIVNSILKASVLLMS